MARDVLFLRGTCFNVCQENDVAASLNFSGNDE
jgi:hypothetical protein